MYDHVVPHLRLSDRHLIVPGYPGDAEWWKQEEGKASLVGQRRSSRDMSETHKELLDILRKRDMTIREIQNMLNTTFSGAQTAITAISRTEPVYEEKLQTGGVLFGILGRDVLEVQ